MNKNCLVISAFLLTACASVPQYQPQPVPRDQALKLVEQCLREQPPDVGPIEVEVTDEFMRAVYSTTESSYWTGGIASKTEARTAYYKSVSRVELDRDEGMFTGVVYNRADEDVLYCYSEDVETVKRFVDGVSALRP